VEFLTEGLAMRTVEKVVVGTLTVKEDFEVRRSGETASNYTVTLVKAGEYPVEVQWSRGKRVLVSHMKAFLLETYYVNRVFTASSVDHQIYEDGRCPSSYQWRWGDHDRCRLPPMDIFGDIRLVLDEPWVFTADYRGNYSSGAPIIFYDLVELGEKE